MDVVTKLKSLHLTLPSPPDPAGSYRPVILQDSLAYLSGQISKSPDGRLLEGKLGKDLSLEKGQEAARYCALNAMSVIHHHISSEKFDRVLRITGYVQCHPEFTDIHKVMNGASDLFLEVYGECGIHARSAVGAASLPLNAAVEIEVTLKLKVS